MCVSECVCVVVAYAQMNVLCVLLYVFRMCVPMCMFVLLEAGLSIHVLCVIVWVFVLWCFAFCVGSLLCVVCVYCSVVVRMCFVILHILCTCFCENKLCLVFCLYYVLCACVCFKLCLCDVLIGSCIVRCALYWFVYVWSDVLYFIRVFLMHDVRSRVFGVCNGSCFCCVDLNCVLVACCLCMYCSVMCKWLYGLCLCCVAFVVMCLCCVCFVYPCVLLFGVCVLLVWCVWYCSVWGCRVLFIVSFMCLCVCCVCVVCVWCVCVEYCPNMSCMFCAYVCIVVSN